MTIEYRVRSAAPTAAEDGNRLTGRAIVFNSPTMIGRAPWGFREQVNPKALNKTLNDGDQVLLDNHDSARPLARASAGTLEQHVGRKGLDWQASVTDTTYAMDVVKNVRAGNYGGCSFSFEVISDTWDEGTDDGVPLRTLNEINLREISVVTFPAYTDTTVSARSAVETAMEFRNSWYEREIMEWRADNRDAADGDGKDPKKPYGDVDYADPGYQSDGKKRYPIDTKEHVKAAWSYINQGKNGGKYTSEQLAHIKGKIKSAAKKFGIDIAESNSAPDLPERILETSDFRLVSVGEWSDREWSYFTDELKWIDKNSANDADGEPGTTTRLTKDEQSRAAEDFTKARLEYAKQLRAEQARIWGK